MRCVMLDGRARADAIRSMEISYKLFGTANGLSSSHMDCGMLLYSQTTTLK